jgi:hypothetical protein
MIKGMIRKTMSAIPAGARKSQAVIASLWAILETGFLSGFFIIHLTFGEKLEPGKIPGSFVYRIVYL